MKPGLIYYNDAHHFNAKRIDPPARVDQMQWPVDEVIGTGVGLLVFGLGYGDVYFHQSKTGRVVGQFQEKWNSFIDWRIMRMVETAKSLGTDQLEIVLKRGKDLGLPVFPSLKLQDSNPPGSDRCGLLKWRYKESVCIGEEGRACWCYNFADERVQKDKLAVIHEVLNEYEADGLELDFVFDKFYFKQAEVQAGLEIMTGFLSKVRSMANEIGKKRGSNIPILVRVPLREDDNINLGLDISSWLENALVDIVAGEDDRILVDTGIRDRWLVDIATKSETPVYYRPPRRIYDHRVGVPSPEMYRALGQTLRYQGYAGLYHGYLPWPFGEREYQILREGAYPEIMERQNKLYLLQPREGPADKTTTPDRLLPSELEPGKTDYIRLFIADDIRKENQDKALRYALLTLRFAFFCVEDDIEIRLNDHHLDFDKAETTDERALTIKTQLPDIMELDAHSAMSAHWFTFTIDADLLRQGDNILEIETRQIAPAADFKRTLNGVEIEIRYKTFERPLGFNGQQVDPAG